MQESYDSISLFLCTHLTHKFRANCHKGKGIHALDKYFDGVLGLLWHRLRTVMASNIQSIKDCDPLKMKNKIK